MPEWNIDDYSETLAGADDETRQGAGGYDPTHPGPQRTAPGDPGQGEATSAHQGTRAAQAGTAARASEGADHRAAGRSASSIYINVFRQHKRLPST